MKKLLGIVLSAAMLLSMAACGSKNTDTGTDTKTGRLRQHCCIQRCIQRSSRFYR